MFAKFSVKKPLTVVVAVIVVLVLGVMSFINMTPDLLPNMEFPYVIVMTTYPGASPEEVEETINKPLEESMSTLENITSVSSVAGENYSTIMLEFTEDANMDTATIDIREKLDMIKGEWDDTVGNPFIMKISANLMPISVAAVDMEGKDIYEISEFVEETIASDLESIEGVASITKSGILEKQLNVVISEDKINEVNKEIQKALNNEFADAEKELEDSKQEVEDGLDGINQGLEETETGKETLNEQEKALSEQLASAQADLDQKQQELLETKLSLVSEMATLEEQINSLNSTKAQLLMLKSSYEKIVNNIDELNDTLNTLKSAQITLSRLNSEQAQYNTQIEAIENNPDLTASEKQIMIAAITNSDEYKKTQEEFEELDKLLESYYTNRTRLPITITTAQIALDTANTALDTLINALARFNISPEQIDDTIKQLDEGIKQIEAGISEMEKALTQLDEGEIGIQSAKEQLLAQSSQATFEMSSALTEIVSAQSTLTSTEKELNAALTQIENGMDELDTAKETAIESADATKTITMNMVSQILTAQNFSMPAGYVTEDNVDYLVKVGDKFANEDEISDLMLFDMGIDGLEPIYLTDVADVFISDNANEIYAKINNNDGVMLSFTKQSNYATAVVADNITNAFTALSSEYEGLHFTSLMNQGDYIDLIINNVFQNLLFGAALAIVILLFFLKDIRPTLIIACSIPLSVIFAIVLMYFSGVTLNIISLSGLAVGVGMLVDNSVVVIENIYRLRNRGESAIKAAVSGTVQVAGAITASTLTTICVFSPIVFIQGITRQLFTDLALTIAYSLLASLIVALTLVPAMSQSLLKKSKPKKESKIFDKLINSYEKSAKFVLRHRIATLILTVVVLISSVFFTLQKGFIFMPDMAAEQITVTVETSKDLTFEETTAITDTIAEIAQDVDGVETVGAMVGASAETAALGISTASSGTSVTMYVLPDENSNVPVNTIAENIELKCSEEKSLDGIDVIASTASTMSLDTLSGSGVSVNVYSDDLNVLAETSEQITKEIENIEGVESVDNGIEDSTPEIKITVDKEKAMKEGLTVAQVFMDLSQSIQSETTSTTLTTDDENLDVIVVDEKAENLTPDDIRNYKLTVTDREGNESTVALTDIAEITDSTTLNHISRDNKRRTLSITAETNDDRNITLVSNDIKSTIDSMDLDDSVTIEYAGENESTMEAIEQLMLLLLLAVVLIYLIMVAQFQSFLSPFIVMFTIPLAFTGGLLALLLTNNTISVISLVGFVMLSGIIVNNGIVLIDYINQLRADGMDKLEAIITAGKTRMRPILMTALTTILGLSTMAIGMGSGAAMMQPIAIVCIGGLIYATILTLYVVPIMYSLLVRKEIRVVTKEDLEIIED